MGLEKGGACAFILGNDVSVTEAFSLYQALELNGSRIVAPNKKEFRVTEIKTKKGEKT